ncbi:MAG TPA: hypothetical protein VHQ22_12405 [Terriglobales bacterium]|jgi:hypothetical protein|nr:hypothetical protein [Terriglobales bacterium]
MLSKSEVLVRSARLIIEKCLGLHYHDAFLLIFDETTRHFPSIFKQAAEEAQVTYRQVFVSTKHQAAGRHALPASLLDSLKRSRGILLATTDDERCAQFRIGLTSDLRQAGTATGTMPGASLDILSTAIDVDYNEIIRMCRDLTVPLVHGHKCVVTTKDRQGKSYILTFALGGLQRIPIQSYAVIPLDAWGNIPAGETFVAPLEESANGQYVVNGAIGTEKVTGSKEVVVEFENGRLTRHYYVHSGKPVEHILCLKETAGRNSDIGCWNVIAEFGIGVNKKLTKITGVQLIDEKRYGTIHVAIGNNSGYGGTNRCPSVHCDMTTVGPDVQLDGHELITKGEHVYKLGDFLEDYLTFNPGPGKEWISSHVSLDKDAYEINSDGDLLVKHITQSGRRTLYALGNEMTSKKATELVRCFKDSTFMVLDDLKRRIPMQEDHFLGLLGLLAKHGVILT